MKLLTDDHLGHQSLQRGTFDWPKYSVVLITFSPFSVPNQALSRFTYSTSPLVRKKVIFALSRLGSPNSHFYWLK